MILLSIIGCFALVFIAGKINLSVKFDDQVKELFSQAKNISGKIFIN
jgi:hypothetical protein